MKKKVLDRIFIRELFESLTKTLRLNFSSIVIVVFRNNVEPARI